LEVATQEKLLGKLLVRGIFNAVPEQTTAVLDEVIAGMGCTVTTNCCVLPKQDPTELVGVIK
jgi:hypothetical protein